MNFFLSCVIHLSNCGQGPGSKVATDSLPSESWEQLPLWCLASTITEYLRGTPDYISESLTFQNLIIQIVHLMDIKQERWDQKETVPV